MKKTQEDFVIKINHESTFNYFLKKIVYFASIFHHFFKGLIESHFGTALKEISGTII